MPDRRTRVLIIGAGPAGLAAAARVLERGGDRVRVRLAMLGHHFGGKADSWRDREGRLIDHGQHVICGWYHEMKSLLRRAGIDVEASLVGNDGHTFTYEPRDGRVHDLALKRNPFHVLANSLGYSGLTAAEKRNIASFVIGNAGVFLGLQDIEPFDDICFTAWCIANGLRPSIVQTSAFRMSRTAQLNWPGEISAYSMLRSIRRVGRDYRSAQYAFCDGGMSERYWQPVGRYLSDLGCQLEMMRKLVGFQWRGDQVTGVRFAEPDSAGHDRPEHAPGRSRYEHTVAEKPRTETLDTDFDYVICAIPVSALRELNAGDDALWSMPAFAGIRRLRGVPPLALQIWHRERVTRRYQSVIAGLPGPLGFVLDNKPIIREYRHDPRYGAVLYFVGQERGYEQWSDEDHLTQCLANVSCLPGYERIDRAGVLHYRVIRNRSVDKLYFLTEPGVQRYRPGASTPLRNLLLAGDWVRGEIDFPCMEAAVRSGNAAADAVLARAR